MAVVSKKVKEGFKERDTANASGGWGVPTPNLTSHQPLEHSTMQYSSSVSRLVSQPTVKPGGFSQKVLLVLLLSICSTTAPPCLGTYRQIRVCQTLL